MIGMPYETTRKVPGFRPRTEVTSISRLLPIYSYKGVQNWAPPYTISQWFVVHDGLVQNDW